MKRILLLLTFLSLAAASQAHLSDYPAPFIQDGRFTAQIIVGSNAPSTDALAATEIAVSLQQKSSSPITAETEEKFDAAKNAILIGLPCQNPAMATALETSACDIGLNEGEGYLKLIDKGSTSYLIVTGKAAAETRKAARFLANEEMSEFAAHELRIAGTLDNPVAETGAQPLEIKKTPAKAECQKDGDCREDQSCIATKCLDLGCWDGTTAKDHDCVPVAEETIQDETLQQPAETAASKTAEEGTEEPEANPEQAKPQGILARIVNFFLSLFS